MSGELPPRGTTVSPSATTHASTEPRTIPIVLVPGIMASRLADAETHLEVWNPTGRFVPDPLHPIQVAEETLVAGHNVFTGGRAPGTMAANAAILGDTYHHLKPDVWNTAGYPWDRAVRAAGIHGFYGVIPDFYDELCFTLNEDVAGRLNAAAAASSDPALRHQTFAVKVYCCGYDWRRSNRLSANRLARVVTLARNECHGEQVILVAHSMGGIVSRYYCKHGGESQVRALILIASPTLGAAKPYVWLKRGISSDEADFGMRQFLFHLSQAESRDFMRHMPAIYQLAPNHVYASSYSGWLQYEPARTGFPETPPPGELRGGRRLAGCADTTRLYRDLYTGFLEAAQERSHLRTFVDEALAVHDFLTVRDDDGEGMYMHPETYTMYCPDMATVTGAQIVDNDGTFQSNGSAVEYVPWHDVMNVSYRTEAHGGDTSVPAQSARPPDDHLRPRFCLAEPRSGVGHSDLPNDRDVRDFVVDVIAQLRF